MRNNADMTVRAETQAAGGARGPEPSHPLQRLGADEIRRARTLLAEHGLVGEHTRFAYLGLEEPPKGEVLAFRPGQPVERRVQAILLDTATGAAADVVASLTRGAIDTAAELDTARDGQPPIMVEDLAAVDEIVKADSGWRAAMARRGITELDLVRPARCRPGRSASRARRAGACSGCSLSCSTTRRTTRGRTRSTAWSPTWTSSNAACST